MQRGREDEPGSVSGQLERIKSSSWSQLMIRTARRLDDYMLRQMHERRPELAELRRAHLMLFPHIDLQGTRLSELAARLGVSKQAVGQLVDDLERMGVVERTPDRRDRRAKLVRFAQGGQGLIEGVEGMRRAEIELECALKEGEGARLRDTLEALLEELERRLG